ncbi:hypothetical protein FGB62_32g017 [Gracilaria domingensis]|nr:hypothetical protein FGB62_32g017 [Gracilaria domingensis]
MRRILFAAARVWRSSSSEEGLSDSEESVGASEDVISTAEIPDGDQETAAPASPTPLKPRAPVAPAQPPSTGPLPTTPTRRRSSRIPMELRRIGASPEVMKSPTVPSSYNLRSRRRPGAPSTRTDSVAISRPAFLHKRDMENASSATLRAVCNRFGIDATGTKDEMRARALAKMAERTADDFSARPADEQDDPAPVIVDRECTDERANCLTTSTTKKNLASVNDPIIRGVGDVHGKSDKPDADVNMPPAPPQPPVESRPARSWVTDRSVMEKSVAQGPPPTPPLIIPRAALPPRGSPPSPINNPAESVDVSAPLNAGSIFQDWLRTNRRLSAAEYDACVQALRGSVNSGSSLPPPPARAPVSTTNLGVAMVPSAIVKRAPFRSATLGLPSPVAPAAVRAGMPSTPGVRSSTGVPAPSRMEVTQRVPLNEGSHKEARGSLQKPNVPVPNDVTSERNMQGAGHRDLFRRLQQSSQSMPLDTSSTAMRKEAESTPNGERALPPRFSGAIGGPGDQNVDRSLVARRHLEADKKEDKPHLDGDWMQRLLGEKFKDVPMKEDPQYGDMVPPEQLLKHFNERRASKEKSSYLSSREVVTRNSTAKKRWELRPHPKETVARIRKRNQDRERHKQWQERLRVLDKEKREEARRSLYEKKPIESETGGELIDVRNVLSQKKTRYELAQVRERLQRPVSPPLPPRARRALRFLKALKEDTSHLQTRVRKPDSLPPLPPRLKKVRVKGGFTGTTSIFGEDSSSDSSVDYERPPDEIILWKRLKRRQERIDRKLKEKQAHEREDVVKSGVSRTMNDLDVANSSLANTFSGGGKQGLKKEENGDPKSLSAPKSTECGNGIAKDKEKHQGQSDLKSTQGAFTSLPGNKLSTSPNEASNPFEMRPSLSPGGSSVAPVRPSIFGAGKAAFGSIQQPASNGNGDGYGKSSDLPRNSFKPGLFELEQHGGERKSDPSPPELQSTGESGFRSSLDAGANPKFEFGKLKEQAKNENERKPDIGEEDQKSGPQRKRKMQDVESISKSTGVAAADGASVTTNMFPTQGQRDTKVRNVSDKSDFEPTGSNGKTSTPLLLSSVPALANSQSPSARSGKDTPHEEAINTAEIPPVTQVVDRNTGTDHDGSHKADGAETGQDHNKQAPGTGLFSVTGTAPVGFGKEAVTAAKLQEGPKQDILDFNNLRSKPADHRPSKKGEATKPASFVFTPSTKNEPSTGAFTVPSENKSDFQSSGKELGPSGFTNILTAPSVEKTPSGQPPQIPALGPVQGPIVPNFPGEQPDTQDEKEIVPTKPPSTTAQKPFTFGAANPSAKNVFGNPSFGLQNTSNPFSLKKAQPSSVKASEDAMATTDSPVDRKDSKSLFGVGSKESSAQVKPFGGFKDAKEASAPVFGSAQTQVPATPFSFNKPADDEQKQTSGPFGDSKFSSGFKPTGPTSSFVFGAGKPTGTANPNTADQTPFSADASKPQTESAKPNPFAPSSNSSSFTAAPTGFGTSSQSQGFSFSGGSSAFGSCKPVDKPSSFGAQNFGNTSSTGFGEGGSNPTFSFGAGAPGGAASTFAAPSGNAAPNPFAAPNPTQNTFGAQPFSSQPDSQPLFGATPSAPFAQGNPFGGNNNNTQSGLGGRPNEAPVGNGAFNAQGGQPGGPGAFAMGSTAASSRRKLKARRMLR